VFEASGSIETAERLVDAIYGRILLFGRHPHLGRQRDDLLAGIRLFPVGDYVLLYRVEEADAVVARVVHGSRDLEALFDE
jgi:toxin ParE1/3/4